MKIRSLSACTIAAVTLCAYARSYGQTHVVKSDVPVVRAVAVYEWTGDVAKPLASRLVPVSVYINRNFEDAGVYLARPVPFALETGTVFELEKAGREQGTLELAFARHLESPERTHIDDGWFAYGAFKPNPVEAPVKALKGGKLPQVVGSKSQTGTGNENTNDSEKTAAEKTGGDRSGAAGAGTTVSAGTAPPIRPIDDEPSLKKPADPDSDSAKDDPDRPTLKKRSPEERKAAIKKSGIASVTAPGDLNDDPDRPNLHRGKPVTRLEDEDLPPLKGIPADMHQMVAVSDARDRAEHDFTRPWDSPEERDHVLTAMRSLAMSQLPAATAKPTPAPAPAARPKVASAAARRRIARAPAPATSADNSTPFDPKTEALNGYTLSYGGAATYVYTAATPAGTFVTLVAQREPDGSLKTALANVTDAAHLDRTPQLRLVDAVDPDASNRASLLFELRGQTSREFALYRVIGAHAEQTIAAGSAQ